MALNIDNPLKEDQMAETIKKSIATILARASASFKDDLTPTAKYGIIQQYIPSLRRQTTANLQHTLFLLSRKETSSVNEFQIQLVEEALKARKKINKRLPMERNYAEAPIFSVTNRSARALVKLQNKNGEIVESRKGYRKIEYYGKNDLTTMDFKVFAGLQKLWDVKGHNKKFSLKFAELCEVLDLALEGGNYKLVGDSIFKLSTTSIVMEDYNDPLLKKSITTRVHNLIQSAEINRDLNSADIVFNDYLQSGLELGNRIDLDALIFNDLGSLTTKLLYPLLSSLLTETKTLDLDKIIQSLNIQNKERKAVLKQLRESFDDLKNKDLIEEYTFIKVNRSYKMVEVIPTKELINALDQGITLSKES
ncbi:MULTISPECIES: hypothetical protein [Alkalihalophilus]|uniref:Uncharacterized protein n=1 Tax=Alkalihalophilus pseudofirmus (strain ATCC BAA-2126 / JCM 17055 / OF4) TaxID=398511 RepID=D3G1E2_ALKPO|nr:MULTISPECIES: hypothetical protein [Alkalihalophilus]ADC52168.1 hypothetical protein BpOF4_20864 [Alkalihalophilus pseudofirmus OF4]MEC2074195.1 hypothetical protein [Alkalihalophilus marmarensis]